MKKLLLLIGFASLTMNAQVPTYVPTNGLVGWYPFNGNANDLSGNGYNGTNNGAVLTNDRFGNTNSAYSFNGDTSYIMTNYTGVAGNNPRTICFWAMPSSNTGDNYVFSYGAQTPGGTFASWVKCSSSASFVSTLSNSVINYDDATICNNWNFYTIVVPVGATIQSDVKLYKNGALLNNFSYFNPSTQINTIGTSPFQIGRLFYNLTINYFKGNIDDIGIWDRALTPSEITTLYYADSCQSLTINTGVLSYNPPTYNNTITIYPNPASDQITIDCGNLANVVGFHIEIVNTLGQIVFNQPMNTQQYNVPLNTWSGTGVYFVKIYDGSNNLLNTKKIILQ